MIYRRYRRITRIIHHTIGRRAMSQLQKYLDKSLETILFDFLQYHGKAGLVQALQLYADMQQEYLCKTKNSMLKIKLGDIFYLKIQKHTITIHTGSGIYKKYGSLNNELKILPSSDFIRCSKNCIVSLRKIKDIRQNDIILMDNSQVHMSRSYAARVIIAYQQTPSVY